MRPGVIIGGLVAAGMLAGSTGAAAARCGLALLLAVDVSGSINEEEYQLQVSGLAAALNDPVVVHALVEQQAAVAMLQWTGTKQQSVTIPWRQMRDVADVRMLAAEITAAERRWYHFSTAIGDALDYAGNVFAEAPACARQVIDVSGDGSSNQGVDVTLARDRAVARAITVNGLTIGGATGGLGLYFRSNVIGGDGAFVIEASDYHDYPRAIRRKLIREVVRPES